MHVDFTYHSVLDSDDVGVKATDAHIDVMFLGAVGAWWRRRRAQQVTMDLALTQHIVGVSSKGSATQSAGQTARHNFHDP